MNEWRKQTGQNILYFRTSGGRLHLLQDIGKIPLVDATLIEEPNDSDKEDESKQFDFKQHSTFVPNIDVIFKVDPDVLSQRSNYRSTLSVNEVINSEKRDFKIMVETKSNTKRCIHLVAPTVQDKEAWISDISQCIDNIHLHSVNSFESIGPQLSLHSDPRLFTDDIDIRFSRTLNSCKLPQVRYATPERLLQRLTGERIKSNQIISGITKPIK